MQGHSQSANNSANNSANSSADHPPALAESQAQLLTLRLDLLHSLAKGLAATHTLQCERARVCVHAHARVSVFPCVCVNGGSEG